MAIASAGSFLKLEEDGEGCACLVGLLNPAGVLKLNLVR